MKVDETLDVLGILEGTDKNSARHDYLRYYATIFSHLRDAKFNLIEIGVSRGASLWTWKSYFRHAQIVGIDINPDCKNLEEESIIIEIGSQEDPEFIDRVFSAYPPAIVIDDGSHLGHHVLFSFERIFPYLLPGGYYIIEDMNNNYIKKVAKKFRGIGPIAPPDYFLRLSDDLVAGEKNRPPSQGVQKSLRDTVQSVTFIRHAIVVTKKTAVMAAETLALAEKMATKSGSADHWHRLFRYIIETCGPFDRAEAAARNAIKAGGNQGQYLNDLAYVIQRQGRIDEAIRLSKHAVAARPDDPSFLLLLGQLYLKKRDAKAAEVNFRNAIKLNETARPGQRHLGMRLEKHLSRALELQYEWQAAIEAAARALELGHANPHWSVSMRQILKRLRTRMTRSSAKEPIVVADSENHQN